MPNLGVKQVPLPPEWLASVSYLLKNVPYVSEAMSVLPVIGTPDIPYAAVGPGAIMINAPGIDGLQARVEKLELKWFPTASTVRAVMLLHESLHRILRHRDRMPAVCMTNKMLRRCWGKACDYIVNLIVAELFSMPPFNFDSARLEHLKEALTNAGCYDERFIGQAVEEVFATLVKEEEERRANQPPPPPHPPKPQHGSDPDGEEGECDGTMILDPDGEVDENAEPEPNKGPGSEQPPPEEEEEEEEEEFDPFDFDHIFTPEPPKPEEPKPDEPKQEDPGSEEEEEEEEDTNEGYGGEEDDEQEDTLFRDDDVTDAPETGVGSDIEALIEQRMQDYAQRHQGDLPGMGATLGAEWNQAMKKPPIDMRKVMRKVRDTTLSPVFSYRRPGRNDMHSFFKPNGGRLPSASPDPGDKIREVLIVSDSSGSFGQKERSASLRIAADSFKHTERKVRILEVTNQVVRDEYYTTDKEAVRGGLRGNGGTYLAAIIPYIKENNIKPSVIVLITDGYDSYHSKEAFKKWNMLRLMRTIVVGSDQTMPGICFHADLIGE